MIRVKNILKQHQKFLESIQSCHELRGASLTSIETGGNFTTRIYRENLSGSDFKGGDLRGILFIECNLENSNFEGANLAHSGFLYSKCCYSNFREANMFQSTLEGADFSHCNLAYTNLYASNLTNTKLNSSRLTGTNFTVADLVNTDFERARVDCTIFSGNYLNQTKNLTLAEIVAPPSIAINSVEYFDKEISHLLLNPETTMKYIKHLESILIERDFSSCFISYSSQDDAFVKKLCNDLDSKGVRYWLDKKSFNIGEDIREGIEKNIYTHEKTLLILSKHSINSSWVKNEMEICFEKEAKMEKASLIPINIDDHIENTKKAWASSIRRTKHIGDFTSWEKEKKYNISLQKLFQSLVET